MKDKNIRILSTRPLDNALVNKALGKDIILDSISFIETENIIDQNISDQIGKLAKESFTIVFTSINGAEAVMTSLSHTAQPRWTIYCIGAATQTAVKACFT